MAAISNKRDALLRTLEGIRGITGVGIGWDANGNRCLKVNIDSRTISAQDRDRIPRVFESEKVLIDVVYGIRAVSVPEK